MKLIRNWLLIGAVVFFSALTSGCGVEDTNLRTPLANGGTYAVGGGSSSAGTGGSTTSSSTSGEGGDGATGANGTGGDGANSTGGSGTGGSGQGGSSSPCSPLCEPGHFCSVHPDTLVAVCCQDGTEQCVSGQCIHVQTNVNHCGQCDDPCDPGEICEAGSCGCTGNATQLCYSGSLGTEGVGQCLAGQYVCENGSWSQTCAGEVLPGTETCNGLDDDCNWVADNGNPEGGQSCQTGKQGICADGISLCQVGGSLVCLQSKLAVVETCNGLDDNCDGTPDDGNPGAGQFCDTLQLGNCRNGTSACQGGGIVCVADEIAIAEICDGKDNDCDDIPDNGCNCVDNTERNCYTGPVGTRGYGLCIGGSQLCTLGDWGTCDNQVLPDNELCNGFDDDCDAQSDEGNPEGGGNCPTGQPGICADGTENCLGGGLVCIQNLAAIVEKCDGLDNDCDGPVDEDNPGGDQFCTTGQPGICLHGSTLCSSGSIVCVSDETANLAEACDARDDDCDGEVDEGCNCIDTHTQDCYNGPVGTRQVGLCINGSQLCTLGSWGTCTGEVVPATELCDGLDNDCDGPADENNPEGGGQCTVPGKFGVFADGTEKCLGGGLQCQQNLQATIEICDNLDNDCDDVIDDNNPDGGQLCFTGESGICMNGLTSCESGGNLVCQQQVTANQVEQCDGVDDNCDGDVDENCNCTDNDTQKCYNGLPITRGVGVCTPGDQLCSAGAWGQCLNEVLPSGEVCDGLDNDCDGPVDEKTEIAAVGTWCDTTLQGVCQDGEIDCRNGILECDQVTQATSEICDGLDNDCLNGVDDGNPGSGAICLDTGLPGRCSKGHTDCQAGNLECVPDLSPIAEVCNNLDDDCDGVPDNNNCPCTEGQTQWCYTGPFDTIGIGSCIVGQQECNSQGVWGPCNGEKIPTPETCNNIDDDCNGNVDEFNPGGGGWCDTTLQGVCQDGTLMCTGGALSCLQNYGQSAEICDGLDNDCVNGPDDGNPQGGAYCTTGLLGICQSGATACEFGTLVCNQLYAASPEVCDNANNDCDSQFDEGCLCTHGAMQNCYNGPPGTDGVGLCHAGQTICNLGIWGGCLNEVVPGPEICTGGDDEDCDNLTDCDDADCYLDPACPPGGGGSGGSGGTGGSGGSGGSGGGTPLSITWNQGNDNSGSYKVETLNSDNTIDATNTSVCVSTPFPTIITGDQLQGILDDDGEITCFSPNTAICLWHKCESGTCKSDTDMRTDLLEGGFGTCIAEMAPGGWTRNAGVSCPNGHLWLADPGPCPGPCP